MKINNLNQINIKFKENNHIKNKQSNFNDIKKSVEEKKLEKSAKELESMFIKQIFEGMKKDIDKNSLIEKSYGRKIFEDMQNEQFSKKMSEKGDLGIAKTVYDQLKNSLPATKEEKESALKLNEDKLKK